MSDLIDRRVAYETLTDYYHHRTDIQHTALREALNKVPSAQPDVPDTIFGNMISRQAAIDAVRSYYDECDEQEESIEERIERLPSADIDLSGFSDKLWAAAYERGKTEAQQRWIPCSEKLPDKDGLYLVTTSKGQVQMHVFNHNGNSEEYWMRCNKAWMPLPEPYKGETING